ncbi:pilus assembly PilX family protein (plasmid) [Legionella sp. D16C41]|uniref:pilus assembly PilX family protein n=1 Tax=Legionella sp. D16C41 TaxID=3402688 RepID=UPI003AF44026
MIKVNSLMSLKQGSALIVTLILLFLLSILAIRAASFNSIQTRIATNAYDALIAFSTAEGALNDGINKLLTGTYSPTSFAANQNGLYLFNPNTSPPWTMTTWPTAIQSYQGNSNTNATYFIEQLPSVTMPGQNMARPTQIYRITARAVGASGTQPIILQTIIQISQ